MTTSRGPIYLDNAATSFPKPECVYDAVDRYQRTCGVAVGRGAYTAATTVSAEIHRCRQRAAKLLHAESPERIIFTFNGTDGLNLAIQGLLQQGNHVVTSQLEHNSVIRPLRQLEQAGVISLTVLPADQQGVIDPDAFRKARRPDTRLFALTHASNVTGTIQPVTEVGQIARESGIRFLVDAAQTAGSLPIDVQAMGADLLACPGHKGLLGPLGTGLLYVRPGLESELASIRQGGTGTRSEDPLQPDSLPDKYEAGNHNGPGLIGLAAALDWLLAPAQQTLHQRESELLDYFLSGLRAIPAIEFHGRKTAEGRLPVVSVSLADVDPQEIATLLDQMGEIQVRSGLHCAPGAHQALGTFERGGTVRFSLGAFTTREELDRTLDTLAELAAGFH